MICSEGITWQVGDAVKTKYGIGKIIDIRRHHHVPLVIVLSYGLGYFKITDVQPYKFTHQN